MDFNTFYKENVQLAYGCTEPVAVAFTSAHASALIRDSQIRKIDIVTDPNIFKNGFGAGIPNSDGKTGNLWAAAIGAFLACPDRGFEIFSDISDGVLEKAQKFLEEERVNITVDSDRKGIYIMVKIHTYSEEYSVAETVNDHLGISRIIRNGELVFEKKTEKKEKALEFNWDDIDITDILKFVRTSHKDEFNQVESAIEKNCLAAEYGYKNECGIKLGFTLKQLWEKEKICHSIENYIKYMVASACDARMSGQNIGVMTLCGSGNQGIAASLPVKCFYDMSGMKNRTELHRALALSFLITGYIKKRLGKLSPVCGCVVASGSGAAAGISYLMGGDDDRIKDAVKILLADMTGVICDGAKGSCSLKLTTAVASAYDYSVLASEGCVVDHNNGIIEETIEDTIENLRKIAVAGMSGVDSEVVRIFREKLEKYGE